MFGFDVFPIAAASLDLTVDFSPLFTGLCGALVVSATGIAMSAVSFWFFNRQRSAALPLEGISSESSSEIQAKAA